MDSQTTYPQDDRVYQQARRQVLKTKGFYSHLLSYLIVNAVLVAINLLFTPDYYWFIWPLLGWGVGLLFHAACVYRPFSLFPKDWEERKIREYVEKARRG